MSTEFDRRIGDARPLNIEEMIANEDDPGKRAMLIVLLSINSSLLANTRTIVELSAKLEEHRTKLEKHLDNFDLHIAAEDEILNKGRGAWRVLAWVLGAAQIAVVTVISMAWSDLSGIHSAINSLAMVDTRHESRLQALEKK